LHKSQIHSSTTVHQDVALHQEKISKEQQPSNNNAATFLSSLTSEQKRAVYCKEPRTLIIGGPGTGKTVSVGT
jgi:hypothetical protein